MQGVMPQTAIFAPVMAMLLLTMLVWIYMYAKRIPYIQNNNLTDDELKPSNFEAMQPADVANPSYNLKNLFEIPPLFYILAVILFVTNQVDNIYLAASWAFVGLRVLHSIIHCTANIVLLRFGLYALSTMAFWFMVIRASLTFLP